ncbi:MAG: asparaginase [Deltaproteobacteria bacterium]|nr:asparaginase [Deltaproteobacteria bacterium]
MSASTGHETRLLFIAAGGTIAMEKDAQTGRSVVVRTAAELLACSTPPANAKVRCLDVPLALRVLSRPGDLLTLARWVQQEARIETDAVVFAQGTDTLEEVTYFMDEVWSLSVPLIFTAAMRPGWADDYDGERNLTEALRVAAMVPKDVGVLVVMHGEIFEAWSVYKADTGALDAFTARRGAPRGYVTSLDVVLPVFSASRARFRMLPAELPSAVPILTMGIGDDAVLLDRLDLASVRGVVIAGLGAGTIPPIACEKAMTLARSGVQVVLCSSALSGRTAEEQYYPRAYDELCAAGIAIEDHLNARKTRIRLLLSLGFGLPYVPFGEAETK